MDTAAPDPRVDRANGRYFFVATLFTYLAAPVLYVGVTQAALLDKLGASTAVANLPGAAFLVGSFAPMVVAPLLPHRWDRRMVVLATAVMAVLMALVAAVLILPFGSGPRIAAVIGQSLILGLINSLQSVYIYQCLGRGTSEEGRSKALKLTFTFGPLAAVAGSLLAQFILRGGIPGLVFPRDFAALYLIAAPSMALVSWCAARFDLTPLPEETRPPFLPGLWVGLKRYFTSRHLVFLLLAYTACYSTLAAMPNQLLHIREAMGRQPADFSGATLALRFGCKALAGYGLGVLNLRYGYRAPLYATAGVLALSIVWSWVVPGYAYLLAFGLMGMGELSGAYFPNAMLACSPAAVAVSNMSILNLANPLSGLAGIIHGLLADRFGFSASFGFGLATAAAALILIYRIERRS